MWLHHRSLTALVAGLLLTLFLHGTGQVATPAPPDAPLPPGKSVLDDPFQRGVQAWFGAETQLSLPTTPECDRYAPAVAFNSASSLAKPRQGSSTKSSASTG